GPAVLHAAPGRAVPRAHADRRRDRRARVRPPAVRHGGGQQEALQARPRVQPLPAPRARVPARGPAQLPRAARLGDRTRPRRVHGRGDDRRVRRARRQPQPRALRPQEGRGDQRRPRAHARARGLPRPPRAVPALRGPRLRGRVRRPHRRRAGRARRRRPARAGAHDAPRRGSRDARLPPHRRRRARGRGGRPQGAPRRRRRGDRGRRRRARHARVLHARADPGGAGRGARRRARAQAAARVHAAARGRVGAPRVAAAVRVDGDPREGLDARTPAVAARHAVTSTASGREGTGGTGPDGPAVDGVLFDVDDTLVDSTGAFRAALADVAREYLPALPADRHDEVLALWRADPNGHYRRYTRGELDYRAQRRARANEIQAAFGGAQPDDAAFAAWDEVFEEGFVRAWAPHTDADDVVRRLLDAGVAVAALTNAAVGYQTAKLERVGLADRVRVVVGVDTLGVGKPDPRVF